MAIVSILILVFFVLSSILLITIVLIQDDQGGGIGGMFGVGGSAAFGARTGNILTRITTVLAVIFFISAFALAWMNRTPESGNLIGRARAERIRNVERMDWWVDVSSEQSESLDQSQENFTEPIDSQEKANGEVLSENTNNEIKETN